MPNYGTDFSTVPDLDPNMGLISGPKVVLEAIARRLQTPQGWYADDPRYGVDLIAYLGSDSAYTIAPLIQEQALEDDRVASASATLTQATQNGIRVSLKVQLVDDEREYPLTVDITQAGAVIGLG